MKEILTTIASLVVIMFCLAILVLPNDSEIEAKPAAQTVPSGSVQAGQPVKGTLLFKQVQAVKVRNEVLIFVTLDREGLKDYYIPLRGKNVILSQSPNSLLPVNSIKLEENGMNSLCVTLSPTLEIDLMKELTTL
ncbi:hypothetical protein [Gimesia chilikensis]|uniref:hypothetical protein n=1 Tax=Gimesia chilikensis TaxID=2605989 RepID=UPI003A8DE315